jgi:hypothetical protein
MGSYSSWNITSEVMNVLRLICHEYLPVQFDHYYTVVTAVR